MIDNDADQKSGEPLVSIDHRNTAKCPHWHAWGTLKNRILLENYYLPGDLEEQIEAFVADYNHHRYHESIDNLTPADVYFGRGQTILLQRERITPNHHTTPLAAPTASRRGR